MNLTDAIGQSTANMTDEEFAILKRFVEKRDREEAQVTVTPVSTVQPCIPCSLTHEILIGARIYMESNEGTMDPEPTELESPSAGTGFETPGQQCPPNGETGRTTAGRYLLVGMGSSQGGDTSSHPRNALARELAELRRQRLQHRISLSCSRATNPGTRHPAKRTSNLTPVGKDRSHRLETRL